MDNPTILPIYPIEEKPFTDIFKSKWYDRYKNNGCTLDHIQRLYNLDKITLDDFKIITNQEPKEKVVIKNEVSKLNNKIIHLETENEALKEITKEQDQLLVDNAYKITMLEMTLGGI